MIVLNQLSNLSLFPPPPALLPRMHSVADELRRCMVKHQYYFLSLSGGRIRTGHSFDSSTASLPFLCHFSRQPSPPQPHLPFLLSSHSWSHPHVGKNTKPKNPHKLF